MKPEMDYRLYLVTDSTLAPDLTSAVTRALEGGVTLVQVREKGSDGGRFLERAKAVKQVTDHYGVPLIIDDRVDVAMACGAAGVHLGQSDIPVTEARRLLGPDRIIGISAQTPDQARRAQDGGADYLGVGAVFPTSTKQDAFTIGRDDLKTIQSAARIPIVLIGGLDETNIPSFKESGPIAGFALVSAILGKEDISKASRRLRAVVDATLGDRARDADPYPRL